MHLTPREAERLTLFTAAELARRRIGRGAQLGVSDALALICDEILELAWDGHPLEEVIAQARNVVPVESLLPGAASMVPSVQVEALFPFGTVLVHVDRPFGPAQPDGPGAVLPAAGEIELAPGRDRGTAQIVNQGPLPIWISSHTPIDQLNSALQVDPPDDTRRFRLDVPAGVSVRFEPGEARSVPVVALGGATQEMHR